MILRRLAESIRRQDWSTVVVEILIVVLGVFLGIEVANWNEDRVDRTREREYYEQMLSDLQSDVEMTRRVIFDADRFSEHGDYLQEALDDPNFVVDDPDYFVVSVARAGYTRSPVFTRHTIDELVSIGGLTLLRDRELKSAILDYYAFASDSDQWNALLREHQYLYKEAYQGLLSRETERAIGERLSTFDVDFVTWEQEKARLGPQGLHANQEHAQRILERARARTKLHDALPMMAVVHSRHKLRAEVIRDRAEALIRKIEAHIE